MKMRLNIYVTSVLLTIMAVETGCSKSSGYGSSPTPTPSPAPAISKEIKLQSSDAFGNYLVDKDGRTLYFFGNDADGTNHCTGACEVLWPTFNIDQVNTDNLGAGLDAADFSHVTTASGKTQLTYKGWPLYYYAPLTNGANTPEQPGQTKGDNFAGIWFVGKPDYTIMIVNSQLHGQDGVNYKSDYTPGQSNSTYFSDGKGLTLYTHSLDRSGKNNFTAADFSNNGAWPIYETDKVVVPSALDKTLFGSIDVFGKKQLTYKGWPLYYFGQDASTRGSNKGISFPHPGIFPVPVKDIQAAP